MCGIAGLFDEEASQDALSEDLSSMLAPILARGPDFIGKKLVEPGLALLHTRLTIRDLSEAGNQPMVSSCGRYWICYNGEIYNAEALKSEIDSMRPRRWRSSGDTELLLEGLSSYGIDAFLNKVEGMFAFCFYDSIKRVAYLCRDRFGEKPLYYMAKGPRFAFSSSLRSLRNIDRSGSQINLNSLGDYLKYNFVPGEETIYDGMRKVRAGHYLAISLGGRSLSLSQVKYFDPLEIVLSGKLQGQTSEITQGELGEAIKNSVRARTVSDVPIGVFLSGGIDSSLVTSFLADMENPNNIDTFSIGDGYSDMSELGAARAIAKHLGTNHTEVVVQESDIQKAVVEMGGVFSEPFADASQIPMMILCGHVSQSKKVVLTGDGADELFGGYNRHAIGPKLHRLISFLPLSGRMAISSLLSAYPRLLEGHFPDAVTKASKLERVLVAPDESQLYDGLLSNWTSSEFQKIAKWTEGNAEHIELVGEGTNLSIADRIMLTDLIFYLADGVLVKTDRTSMAHGLETRAPFLDTKLFELATKLKPGDKIGNGKRKVMLRNLLSSKLPQELLQKRKFGFGIDFTKVLRGGLRSTLQHHLSGAQIRDSGVFEPIETERLIVRFLKGEDALFQKVWSIFLFQLWWVEQNQ